MFAYVGQCFYRLSKNTNLISSVLIWVSLGVLHSEIVWEPLVHTSKYLCMSIVVRCHCVEYLTSINNTINDGWIPFSCLRIRVPLLLAHCHDLLGYLIGTSPNVCCEKTYCDLNGLLYEHYGSSKTWMLHGTWSIHTISSIEQRSTTIWWVWIQYKVLHSVCLP